MTISSKRWAETDGRKVRWGNVIGGYSGQSGVYTFSSKRDADSFAKYAQGEDFPSLADADLVTAGIPIPVNRERQG